MSKKISLLIIITVLVLFADAHNMLMPPLKVSADGHYFTAAGKPFFWLGDTAWLMFSKLTREEAENYLEMRRRQGFNVIQVMVIHSNKEVNAYGDSALVNKNIEQPKTTKGNTYEKNNEYDYWDHIDWILKRAAVKGIYIALVPVWGSVVKENRINAVQASTYAAFLAKRYSNYPNVIWMNGGDIEGTVFTATWQAIGKTLHHYDSKHLITYHPRGRTQSSTWFHNEEWLSFNSFQSGHKTYAQDTAKKDLNYGEDNWKYVMNDRTKKPAKPTLDAEPAYENIPYGLHDTTLPRWNDNDLRRYAYWSVFAGGCGFTYGNNDVIQMHKPGDTDPAYGSKAYWYQSINNPGALQMVFLKKLMLSRPYFERVPDQSLIAGVNGERYDRLIATRGKNYAFIYTYNGRDIAVNPSKLSGQKIKASWYNTRNGEIIPIGFYHKSTFIKFIAPGKKQNGNDWVLIIDTI